MLQKPNWRRAYHDGIDRQTRHFKRLRKETPEAMQETPLGWVTAGDLSDEEIDTIARLVAESDVEHAINRWNEKHGPASKRKQGIAQ